MKVSLKLLIRHDTHSGLPSSSNSDDGKDDDTRRVIKSETEQSLALGRGSLSPWRNVNFYVNIKFTRKSRGGGEENEKRGTEGFNLPG
jgi:hypothetical protein